MQLTKSYTIEITMPQHLNFKQSDQWFTDVLNLQIVSQKTDHVEQLCDRVLLFVQLLLEVSFIPVFYLGHLSSWHKKNDIFSITLNIGYIEFTNESIYKKTIHYAVKTLFWMMNHPPAIVNRQQFFKSCVEEIIKPIRLILPPGKSRIPILKTAYTCNIPFMHMGNGVYQLGWGSASRKLDRSTTDADSAIGSILSQNKAITANVIRMSGLPAPLHGVAKQEEQAYKIAQQLQYPIVVKPIDLDRGEGVVINVHNQNMLERAFKNALSLSKSKQVIIEKQVEGVCHRLFIVGNQLLYAVKRLPKSILCDGVHSIDNLIDIANKIEAYQVPWLRSEIFPKDELALASIQKFGFDFQSIPPSGLWLPLREIESTQWGGRDEDVTDLVHQDNLDIALRAAKLFHLNVAGIDIITKDIAQPWYDTGAIINEVNYAPLLGGAEISKSYIPKFLDLCLKNKGYIPIEIVVGNTSEALEQAYKMQAKYLSKQAKCYITSHQFTFSHESKTIYMSSNSLSVRVQALLLNNDVDALIIVLQSDEILYMNCLINQITDYCIVSEEINVLNNQSKFNFQTIISKLESLKASTIVTNLK